MIILKDGLGFISSWRVFVAAKSYARFVAIFVGKALIYYYGIFYSNPSIYDLKNV